jgi:hypothetical protein
MQHLIRIIFAWSGGRWVAGCTIPRLSSAGVQTPQNLYLVLRGQFRRNDWRIALRMPLQIIEKINSVTSRVTCTELIHAKPSRGRRRCRQTWVRSNRQPFQISLIRVTCTHGKFLAHNNNRGWNQNRSQSTPVKYRFFDRFQSRPSFKCHRFK